MREKNNRLLQHFPVSILIPFYTSMWKIASAEKKWLLMPDFPKTPAGFKVSANNLTYWEFLSYNFYIHSFSENCRGFSAEEEKASEPSKMISESNGYYSLLSCATHYPPDSILSQEVQYFSGRDTKNYVTSSYFSKDWAMRGKQFYFPSLRTVFTGN